MKPLCEPVRFGTRGKGVVMSKQVDKRIEKALVINQWMASKFHTKYNLPRDEFLSQGLVGIAKANNQFKNGNWQGYVKVAIQNEMLQLCRKHQRQTKLLNKLYKTHQIFHYTIQDITETFYPRDMKTGWFITEKAYRKQMKENYNAIKSRNGNNGGK